VRWCGGAVAQWCSGAVVRGGCTPFYLRGAFRQFIFVFGIAFVLTCIGLSTLPAHNKNENNGPILTEADIAHADGKVNTGTIALAKMALRMILQDKREK